MNKYKDFDNYLKEYPNADGYFGQYGGAYLPEELIPAFFRRSDFFICLSISNFHSLL